MNRTNPLTRTWTVVFCLLCAQSLALSPDEGKSCDSKKDLPSFVLLLSTNETFHDTEEVAIGGDSVGGQVIVRVNDNPVVLFTSGGKRFPLLGWMRSGKNTLRLEGARSSPIFVRVTRLVGNELAPDDVKIVARMKIAPNSAKTTVSKSLIFDVASGDLRPLALFSKSMKKLRDDKKGRKELDAYVGQVYDAFVNSDAAALSPLLFSTRGSNRDAYRDSKAILKAESSRLAKFLEKNKIRKISADRKPPRYVFGDQEVMAYTGDQFKTVFLFEYELNDQRLQFSPL